jgi:hypothetical protein
MFAAPVAESRSSSPHRTLSKTVGRAPSQAGKKRSFRSSELAIDGLERESTDTTSADLAAKRVGLASWEPASIPVFPPSGKVNRLGAGTGPRLQTKLVIGAVGDPLEREADQIAEQVMGAPRPQAGNSARRNAAPQVQRKCSACKHQEEEHGDQHGQCANCGKEDKEKKVARKAVSSAGTTAGIEAPATVSHVLRSPGQPLDRSSRNFFEPRFGYDFGSVRVHTNERAAASARSVGALAYTVGKHIVFGSNQYSAETAAGRRLLAHELAHTLQQGAVDGLGTERAAGSSAEGSLLQRQEAPGVHASAAPAAPYEKSSLDVESRYRRSGLIDAANAVKRCREGNCSKVLTEAEAYAAYRSGRVSAGMGDAQAKGDAGGKGTTMAAAGAAPVLAGALAQSGAPATAGGSTVVESATARAALRWGLKSAGEVVVKEAAAVAPDVAAAAAPAAAPAAAGVASVAIPVALGVYLVVATVDLVGYARFQVALQRQGYVILPNILQVCISGCHHPDAPTDTFGSGGRGMPAFPDLDDKAIRDWIGPSAPAPTFPPVAGKPVSPAAPAAPTTRTPVMPEGLSRQKKEKWRRCAELYKSYKKETGADVGALAGEVKAIRGRLDSLSPKEKLDLCSKIHQLIELIEELIKKRRDYIENECDEFDWFQNGLTESERRKKHEGEVDNVKAQEGNMRGVLKELQDKGIC